MVQTAHGIGAPCGASVVLATSPLIRAPPVGYQATAQAGAEGSARRHGLVTARARHASRAWSADRPVAIRLDPTDDLQQVLARVVPQEHRVLAAMAAYRRQLGVEPGGDIDHLVGRVVLVRQPLLGVAGIAGHPGMNRVRATLAQPARRL